MQPADSSHFELAAVLLGLQLLFAMEALRAAYNLPLAGELPISLEAYAAALKHFKDRALGQVEACKKFQTALNGHNIFAVQAVGTLCEGLPPGLAGTLGGERLGRYAGCFAHQLHLHSDQPVLGGSASGSGTAIAALSR